MEHGGDNPFLMVPVPDSADTRLFIELSSYGADLAEARAALDLAIQGREEGSPLAEASLYLIGHAVVSYCRTCTTSKVRGQLTDHLGIPEELLDVHRGIRAYRNATIAHSQSELAVTYAVGVLDADTKKVREVAGPTVLTPLPPSAVLEFRALIAGLEGGLEGVLEPVRARLEQRLSSMDPASLSAAPKPEILTKGADEFEPNTTRTPYPTGHTQYWDPATGGGASQFE